MSKLIALVPKGLGRSLVGGKEAQGSTARPWPSHPAPSRVRDETRLVLLKHFNQSLQQAKESKLVSICANYYLLSENFM